MRFNVPIEVEQPTVLLTMPKEMPLMCDTDEAERLFGLSRNTLDALRKKHPGFPARKIGGAIRYLVPEMYAWFRDYPGASVPLEQEART